MLGLLTSAMLSAVGASRQPLHPLRLAHLGDWPNVTAQHLYYGDVRAVVNTTSLPALSTLDALSAAPVTARIFWRRRDAHPEAKGILVTDAAGNRVTLASPPQITAACGVVSFVPLGGARTYHVYYLPFVQQGGGAKVHFSWYNCTSHDRECVLFSASAAEPSAPPADLCSTTTTITTTTTVVAIEGRAMSATFDRPDFYMLNRMELTATDEELGALLASAPVASTGTLRVFAEPRERAVRMFDHVPADWARGGEKVSIALNASVGEYFTFQLGVFAPTRNLTHFRIDFDDLKLFDGGRSRSTSAPAPRPVLPASAFTCFNLGGTDQNGAHLNRTAMYGVAVGAVGSLWIGVDLPADVNMAGLFAGRLALSADDGTGSRVSVFVELSLRVVLPPSGQPLPDRGDGDIYSLSRLRWINSARAVDDTVPAPFTAPTLRKSFSSTTNGGGGTGGDGGFTVALVNKHVTIGADGMLAQIAVHPNVAAFGAPGNEGDFELLARPLQLKLVDASGTAVALSVSAPAVVVGHNSTGVYWEATLSGAGVRVHVSGSVEYDSFLSYRMEVGLSPGTTALELSDVQLSMAVGAEHARFMCGLGTEGITMQHAALPLAWRWEMGTGNQALWLGRPEAGLMLKLRGEGSRWEDPLFGSDAFVIPFIPSSWGGAACAEQCQKSAYGANVTAAGDSSAYIVTAFSGPRSLSVTAQTTQIFQFDVAATPAKPLNMSSHFAQRYLQVGYGELKRYLSPQAAVARNASVVTLHQGVPGIINGTLVNP